MNLTTLATLLALGCLVAAEDIVQISPEVGIDDYVVYDDYSKNSFKLVPHRVTWEEALVACSNDGKGAHLIIIDNEDEALLAGILFAQISSSSKDLLHVGITDRVREGSWETISNVALVGDLTYHVWSTGKPNRSRYNNDDCGAIDRRAQLNDIPCSSFLHKYPYICKRDNP